MACYIRGKIYVPGSELHHRILSLCHDLKLAGHPGRWKTLELVSRNYWWPQMSRYVSKYVSTCDMCLRTKSICQPPSGQLHPLPIPDAPWCQGTSLAVCTPLYTLSIIHILHSFYFTYIHLLLFGYHLNLSCSQ